jgi:hypothetical protein
MKIMSKIGLLLDERLSHDRKKVFNRNMTVLKFKYSIDFLPIGFDEPEFMDYIKKEDYSVVMIPWHQYLTWKKAANNSHVRVVGYFADPLLHFELQTIPNYHSFVLLDFYRFKVEEIELLLKFLNTKTEDLELIEVFGKKAHFFKEDWYPKDKDSSRCIDQIFESSILKTSTFSHRLDEMRFYLTALWLTCFKEKTGFIAQEPVARMVLAEHHKRLLVQLTFTTSSTTSKDILRQLWPTGENTTVIFRELTQQSDFLKIYHYPDTRKITITALFLPEKVSPGHGGEVRGFWIENRI